MSLHILLARSPIDRSRYAEYNGSYIEWRFGELLDPALLCLPRAFSIVFTLWIECMECA
jgi:hypothetical protein